MAILTSAKSAVHAPAPNRGWALFLDIDGTLLDIAPTPHEVRVPETLIHTLTQASAWLGGALAVVSGRPFSQIDHLLSPLRLPGGAGHGAALRLPDGTTESAGDAFTVPNTWLVALHSAAKNWPGVVVEEKPHSVTVHYRGAPEREADVQALLTELAALDTESYEALPGRMACEIRHRDLTKGLIVQSLMDLAPFKDRVPVFVGDDVTDHDGFRVALEKGGIALDVGAAFAGRPAAVRNWLEGFRDGTANAP